MITDFMDHLSPSSCNLYAACPSMWVMERIKGIKQTVGAPAHRGNAVEAGVVHGLTFLTAPLEMCVESALHKYDELMVLSPDPRRDTYRKSISDMVKQALDMLRKYGTPTATQGYIEWQPEGLSVPIVGYFDFEWAQHGIIGDLKTTERMPSEIKTAHARQVALYAQTDNADARLIYVTPKRIEAYTLENISQHREALRRIALALEDLLSLSDEPDFYMRKFVPDLDSFYWSSPDMRALAYEQWGI